MSRAIRCGACIDREPRVLRVPRVLGLVLPGRRIKAAGRVRLLGILYGRMRACRQQQQEKRHCGGGCQVSGARTGRPACRRAGSWSPSSPSKERIEHNPEDRQSEWQREPLGVNAPYPRTALGVRERCERLGVEPIEPAPILAQGSIGPVGSLRDRAEARFVEARANGGAVLVAHEADRRALVVLRRNQLSGRRADSHRIDGDSRFGRTFGGVLALTLEVFAVGEKNHHLLIAGLRLQCGRRNVDGPAHIRTAAPDDRRVEGGERLEQCVVVERHRALDEGIARERDEADSVAREPLDEIADRELRALEACRGHVVRVHAL